MMTKSNKFVVRYISPGIVRRGEYDFALTYQEDGLELNLMGKEPNQTSDGLLYFPTPSEWVLQYPNFLGQRERVKMNIISWSNESIRSISFISDFLVDEQKIEIAARQREYEYRSISRPSAEQRAEITRLQNKFLKSFSRSEKLKKIFISTLIPAIISILAIAYVTNILKPHFARFW